ncbi:MAG: phosphatase PAP2 family protein [Candidatus Micrarchaeota archaeon]
MAGGLLGAIGVFFNTDFFLYSVIGLFSLVLLLTVRKKKVFVVAFLLAYLAANGLQMLYQQDRPCAAIPGEVACPNDFGFPSVHAATFAIFPFAALGTVLFWFFLPLSFIVGFSRVWIGVHSLQQVFAGFALGAVIYLLVLESERRLFHKRPEWPDVGNVQKPWRGEKNVVDTRKSDGVFEMDD